MGTPKRLARGNGVCVACARSVTSPRRPRSFSNRPPHLNLATARRRQYAAPGSVAIPPKNRTKKIGNNLTLEEIRHVQHMTRRIAALLQLEPRLEANYDAVKAAVTEEES